MNGIEVDYPAKNTRKTIPTKSSSDKSPANTGERNHTSTSTPKKGKPTSKDLTPISSQKQKQNSSTPKSTSKLKNRCAKNSTEAKITPKRESIKKFIQYYGTKSSAKTGSSSKGSSVPSPKGAPATSTDNTTVNVRPKINTDKVITTPTDINTNSRENKIPSKPTELPLEVNCASTNPNLICQLSPIDANLTSCTSINSNSFYSVEDVPGCDLNPPLSLNNSNINSQNSTVDLENTVSWKEHQTNALSVDCNMSNENNPTNTSKEENLTPKQQDAPKKDTNSSIDSELLPNSSKLQTGKPEQETIKMPSQVTNETVLEMFQQLITKIDSVKTDLTSQIQDVKLNNTTKCEAITKDVKDNRSDINKLQDQCKIQDIKLTQMADTIANQGQVIDELKSQMLHVRRDKLRPNLIIHGIIEKKGENLTNVLQGFFTQTMKITKPILIKKAHRLGNGKYKPIKIVLNDANDKGVIYSNAKNLQDKVNKLNKNYRIEDELPTSVRMARKKARDLAWRNKKSVAEQLTMSVKKGRLYLQDDPYPSQIIKPDTHKLLKLKPDEMSAINALSETISIGTPVEHGTSCFTGYVCDANTFFDVNRGYEW